MSSTQVLQNQVWRAALIYPFVIIVLGVISMTLSDNFMAALPNEENPTSAKSDAKESALAENKSEDEPVLVTKPENKGEDPTPTQSMIERNEVSKQQDKSSGDILASTRETDTAENLLTKYPLPLVLVPGLAIQAFQLYLFYQISSITTDLVRAYNAISFKIACGGGFIFSTYMIMMNIGKLNVVYASSRTGRRAKHETWEGGFYDIVSVISALVIVYSWGRMVWA